MKRDTQKQYRIGDRIAHVTFNKGIEFHKIFYITRYGKDEQKDLLLLSPVPDGKPTHVVYKKTVGKGTFFYHIPQEPFEYFSGELFEL